MKESIDNCLLLNRGVYYPVPNSLLPALISILEVNGIEKRYCAEDETLDICGNDGD